MLILIISFLFYILLILLKLCIVPCQHCFEPNQIMAEIHVVFTVISGTESAAVGSIPV